MYIVVGKTKWMNYANTLTVLKRKKIMTDCYKRQLNQDKRTGKHVYTIAKHISNIGQHCYSTTIEHTDKSI